MRGRGWLSNFSVGDLAPDRGLPLVSAFRWDTGVQLHAASQIDGGRGRGHDRQPRQPARRRRQRGQAGGRPGGAHAGHRADRRDVGRPRAVPDARTRREARAPTSATGSSPRPPWARTSSTRGATICCASRRSSATGGCRSSNAPAIALPLQGDLDARRRPLQDPSRVSTPRHDSIIWDSARSPAPTRTAEWDAPVTRVEVGGGYSLLRNLLLKASFQHNTRQGGRTDRSRCRRGADGVLVLSDDKRQHGKSRPAAIRASRAAASRSCCPPAAARLQAARMARVTRCSSWSCRWSAILADGPPWTTRPRNERAPFAAASSCAGSRQ